MNVQRKSDLFCHPHHMQSYTAGRCMSGQSEITEQCRESLTTYSPSETAQSSFLCKKWAARNLKHSFSDKLKTHFSLPHLLSGAISTYLVQKQSLLASARSPGVWIQEARWEAASWGRWRWTTWWPRPAGCLPPPVSLWSALWECWWGRGTIACVPAPRRSRRWFPRGRCEFLFQNEAGPSQTICTTGKKPQPFSHRASSSCFLFSSHTDW